jgi:hypothetical protein
MKFGDELASVTVDALFRVADLAQERASQTQVHGLGVARRPPVQVEEHVH